MHIAVVGTGNVGLVLGACLAETGNTVACVDKDRSKVGTRSYDVLIGADALAVVTEWNNFREPDFARMRQLMRSPVIFDGRNLYAPEQLRALGFRYYSMGRPTP